jgi:hypothetical protein
VREGPGPVENPWFSRPGPFPYAQNSRVAPAITRVGSPSRESTLGSGESARQSRVPARWVACRPALIRRADRSATRAGFPIPRADPPGTRTGRLGTQADPSRCAGRPAGYASRPAKVREFRLQSRETRPGSRESRPGARETRAESREFRLQSRGTRIPARRDSRLVTSDDPRITRDAPQARVRCLAFTWRAKERHPPGGLQHDSTRHVKGRRDPARESRDSARLPRDWRRIS